MTPTRVQGLQPRLSPADPCLPWQRVCRATARTNAASRERLEADNVTDQKKQ